MKFLTKLYDLYHAAVDNRIKSPHTKKVFHTTFTGAHIAYFGGVGLHAVEVYGYIAMGLAFLSVLALLMGHEA